MEVCMLDAKNLISCVVGHWVSLRSSFPGQLLDRRGAWYEE